MADEIRAKNITVSINMQNANMNKKKPFVSVLMPFDSNFDDTYEFGIKAACESAGAVCERVDEQIFDENILTRIYQQINIADVIVAEMTGRNPNVFYETGYAHALSKRVILLTKESDDIPFDMQHYSHIVYGGKIKELKPQLEKKIKWCLDHPQVEPVSQIARFSEVVISHYYWNTIENSHIAILVYPVNGMDTDEMLNTITQGKPYLIRAEEDMFNLSAKLLNNEGHHIANVANVFSEVTNKDYIYTLFSLIRSIMNEAIDLRSPIDIKSTLVLENAEYVRIKKTYANNHFIILPSSESIFMRG